MALRVEGQDPVLADVGNGQVPERDDRPLPDPPVQLGGGYPRGPAATLHHPGYKLLTIDELSRLPKPTYLIDGLLVAGGLANLFGPSGSYKSFLALDWALSVAAGRDWCGHTVQPGPAVYVAAEGAAGMSKRIEAWRSANPDHDPRPRFRLLAEPVHLLDPASLQALRRALADQLDETPALIVLDTLARSLPGADENSSQDMGQAVEHLDAIRRDFGAAVLPVHHSGLERGRERGSTALAAALDARYEVAGAAGHLTLTCRKMKDDIEHPPIRLATRPVGDSLVLDLVATTNPLDVLKAQVADALREHFPNGASKRQLENAIGGRAQAVRDAADDAVRDPDSPVRLDPTGRHPRYVLDDRSQELPL
jgi:hypothetical protein